MQVTYNAPPLPPGFDDVVTVTPKVGASIRNPRVQFKSFVPGGFVILVTNSTTTATASALGSFAFMVQVTRFAT